MIFGFPGLVDKLAQIKLTLRLTFSGKNIAHGTKRSSNFDLNYMCIWVKKYDLSPFVSFSDCKSYSKSASLRASKVCDAMN